MPLWDSSSIFDVLLWVTFPWFWVLDVSVQVGAQKQTTHQETKTKLSSAMPNRDKTIHCQRKHRKKYPGSNVAAESAPHLRHVAKACDNNIQTIPNNMVLWQRLATCRRGWRPSISNRVPRNPAIPLHLQEYCFLVKLRHFSQKRSLQTISFSGPQTHWLFGLQEVVLPSMQFCDLLILSHPCNFVIS